MAPDDASAKPPPAYFLSLTVENVRCFKGPETLDLSDGKGRPARWTILLGDNGTGKTTLLQCLASLRPTVWDVLFRDKKPLVPHTFLNPLPLGNAELVHAFATFGSMDCKVAAVSMLRNRRPVRQVDSIRFRFGKSGRGDASEIPDRLATLECYGYGASRRLDGSGLRDGLNHPDPCASLFDDEAALTNAEEWLLQADYAALKPGGDDAKQRLALVKNVLTAVLPGVKDIRCIAPPGFGQGAHVEVEHEGVRVPLRSLSSGYRSVLVWMVDLTARMLARYPDTENPLAEPAIVLVDQIDLHLHPKWQRKLIGDLSRLFPETQFIVTAHSPLIVQAAADVGANVAVLRREGDHTIIDQRLESVRGWSADQVLLSGLFELPGVHGPEADAWMAERRAILSKSRLTKADDTRLAELDAQLDTLPVGETPADRRASDLIRRAAAEIEQMKKPVRHRAAVKA